MSVDEKKIFSYVNFAIKAKEVVYGIDNIKTSRANISYIILSKTASKNLLEATTRFCQQKGIPFAITKEYTLDELMHTNNCKVIGVTNQNIAQQIIYLKNQ